LREFRFLLLFLENTIRYTETSRMSKETYAMPLFAAISVRWPHVSYIWLKLQFMCTGCIELERRVYAPLIKIHVSQTKLAILQNIIELFTFLEQ